MKTHMTLLPLGPSWRFGPAHHIALGMEMEAFHRKHYGSIDLYLYL